VGWVNRAALALPIAWLTVYGGACGAGASGVTGDPAAGAATEAGAPVAYEPHLAGDLYQAAPGGPTDEALASVLARKPYAGSPKAAAWIVPLDGARVARATPMTLAWSPTSAALLPQPSGAPREREPSPWARAEPTPPPRHRAPFPWGAERLAHAHNAPYSGVAYLLEISTAAERGVFRLFTAQTSFTPDAALWERLATAQGPITLELRTARFTDNRIDPDGGPFSTLPIAVTFAP
jgi:hypothetical protein